MQVVHLDIETRSACDLKKAGLYKYARHNSTQLNVTCFAFDEENPEVWIPRAAGSPYLIRTIRTIQTRCFEKYGFFPQVHVGLKPPERLRAHIEAGGEIRAHNAAFERTVLNGVAGVKADFPTISIKSKVCTAAKMAAHGLPRALEDASAALGTSPKDVDGANDMRYLSKPRKDGTFADYEDEPARFITLAVYCIGDVLAERGIDKVVPDISPNENMVYWLDQRINDRGVRIDQPAIGYVQKLINKYKAYLVEKCVELTGIKPSQTAVLAEWVRSHGYPQLENLQAETVKTAVKDKDCPEEVKTVLKLYSTHNMKAVTKYEAMMRAVCEDGRLHGMFLYHGANTGRWSSMIVQLQNLFRPVIDDPDTAIAAFTAGDLDWIRALYDGTDPMKVFASCVRGMLIPEEGYDLLFLDYAGIEARVNAWLWGEDWKLQAYRDYDAGTGPDLYKVAYARAFKILIEAVTKSQRQVGKVMELALGYQGGVGAFIKMVDTYGIDLDELTEAAFPTIPADVLAEAYEAHEYAAKQHRLYELDTKTWVTIESLKLLWRYAHPRIMGGWEQLKVASEAAVKNPGQVYKCAGGKIMFKVEGQWLYMRLPSGRRLAYFRPSWDEKTNSIRYWGIDTKTRRYCRTSTYGGKLCENAVQAISRDLLVAAMFRLETAGYPIIGTVHDEVLMEILEGFGSLEHAASLMCILTAWATGLPVAVEGHRAKRFRK